MYHASDTETYVGLWDRGEESVNESLEEFLVNWISEGRPNVQYHFIHRGQGITWPETSVKTLIEHMVDASKTRLGGDFGAGIAIHSFTHGGVDYVAHVSYGDQNTSDVETKDSWNARVSAMLVP